MASSKNTTSHGPVASARTQREFSTWLATSKDSQWEVFADAVQREHGALAAVDREVWSAVLKREAESRVNDARWLVHFMLAAGKPTDLLRSCIGECIRQVLPASGKEMSK